MAIRTRSYADVNWEAHAKAIGKHRLRRAHIVKLAHDLLPTNKIRHRDDPTIAAECPQCREAVEDRDHILRCPHEWRARWREKFLSGLAEQSTKLETAPSLEDSLVEGIARWFEGAEWTPEDLVEATDVEKAQCALGWRQIFNGRMTKGWAAEQDHFCKAEGRWGTSRNGRVRTTSILTHIWTEWFDLWDHRNGLVHGHDAATRALARRAEIERKIQDLYQKRGELVPCDRDLLYDSVQEHLDNATTTQLVNWYNTHWPVFRARFAESKWGAINGVAAISTYFQRGSRR